MKATVRALLLLSLVSGCGTPVAVPVDAASVADAPTLDAGRDAARDDDVGVDAATIGTDADVDDATSDAGAPRIARVVVIGIDGFGGAWLTPELAPTMSALAATGAHTTAMQNALPTTSSTNWMSMISGAHPELHGVLSNAWEPGDSTPPPTIFAALRTARPAARIGVLHQWTDFGRLVEPGVADVVTSHGDEDETMDAAIAFVHDGPFDLLFVHLDLVDHAGHASGWGSAAYETAVTDADRLVARMIEALEDEDLSSSTALVVSADHGGAGLSHGDDTRVERSTPFFVTGPGVSTVEITREVRIWDIAPTVMRLLEVPAPAAWIASPIVEAFGGSPASETPTEPLLLTPTSTFAFGYDETGTGAAAMVSMWHPTPESGASSLGDVATSTHAMPAAPAWTTPSTSPAVRAPVAYEMIWNDRASGGTHDGSLWSPIPPLGYVCLGDVVASGYDAPPLDAVRCVHQSYVVSSPAVRTWSDAGSGATLDGSVWSCPTSTETALGTFYVRRHGASDAGTNRCHALITSRVTID